MVLVSLIERCKQCRRNNEELTSRHNINVNGMEMEQQDAEEEKSSNSFDYWSTVDNNYAFIRGTGQTDEESGEAK